VRASLSSTYTSIEYEDVDDSLIAGLWLAIICFCIEFIGLFAGFTIFKAGLNCFYIFCHFWGALLLAWFIVDQWHYLSYWYTFVFFSAIPAVVELVAIISVFACKIVQYY
jgi:hypothetical protein